MSMIPRKMRKAMDKTKKAHLASNKSEAMTKELKDREQAFKQYAQTRGR